VIRLAQNSAFAGSGGAAPCITSRETAYIINAYLARRTWASLRGPASGHGCELRARTHRPVVRLQDVPGRDAVMVGLTMEALINYYEKTGDVRMPTPNSNYGRWIVEYRVGSRKQLFLL